MKNIIILLSFLVAVGCRKDTDNAPVSTPTTEEVPVIPSPGLSDSQILQFVEDFFADAKEAGFNFRRDLLKFRIVNRVEGDNGPLPTLAGQCRSFNNTDIDVQVVRGLGKTNTRTTVYHELGHCMLYLAHDADPYHIMSEQINPIVDWDGDLREMFDNADKQYTDLIQ